MRNGPKLENGPTRFGLTTCCGPTRTARGMAFTRPTSLWAGPQGRHPQDIKSAHGHGMASRAQDATRPATSQRRPSGEKVLMASFTTVRHGCPARSRGPLDTERSQRQNGVAYRWLSRWRDFDGRRRGLGADLEVLARPGER
jgi:hypothetical protein